MSRATARQKTGVMFALVALVLGISAGAAYGWANEQPTDTNNQGHEQENEHHGNKGGKHKGNKPEENVPPGRRRRPRRLRPHPRRPPRSRRPRR